MCWLCVVVVVWVAVVGIVGGVGMAVGHLAERGGWCGVGVVLMRCVCRCWCLFDWIGTGVTPGHPQKLERYRED